MFCAFGRTALIKQSFQVILSSENVCSLPLTLSDIDTLLSVQTWCHCLFFRILIKETWHIPKAPMQLHIPLYAHLGTLVIPSAKLCDSYTGA